MKKEVIRTFCDLCKKEINNTDIRSYEYIFPSIIKEEEIDGYDGRVSENKIIKQKNIELCEPCSFAIAKILQNAKR